ncbi:MAG TPA: hypothetical protein VE615_00935 [Gaiellaceae bacterium]|nr:hypothetical protein [Gaiellaceae bacterium]
MKGTLRERGLTAAIYAAIIGGSIMLIAQFVPLPTPLWVSGWILFLASVVGAVALAVVTSRRQGVGIARAVARGMGLGVKWIVWFLP